MTVIVIVTVMSGSLHGKKKKTSPPPPANVALLSFRRPDDVSYKVDSMITTNRTLARRQLAPPT